MRYFGEAFEQLLTVDEFLLQARITIEELVQYVNDGLLYPMVPTPNRTLIRRVPSALTERLYECTTSDYTANTFSGDHRFCGFHQVYIDELKQYSELNRDKIAQENMLAPDELLPWISDLRYTSGEYVFIDPGVFVEAFRFKWARVRRFVCCDFPRIDRNTSALFNFYQTFISHKDTNNKFSVSIKTRFFRDPSNEKLHKPIMSSPDDLTALKYLDILAQPLPVSIGMAIKYLKINSEQIALKCLDDYIGLIGLIDKNICEVFTDRQNVNDIMFTNLFIISLASDQWVMPLIDEDGFGFGFESVRFLGSQKKMISEYHASDQVNMRYYQEKTGDRFMLRRYCILRKFVSRVLNTENIRDTDKKGWIEEHIDDSIKCMKVDLLKDDGFREVSKYAGSESSLKSAPIDANDVLPMEDLKENIIKWVSGGCDAYVLSVKPKAKEVEIEDLPLVKKKTTKVRQSKRPNAKKTTMNEEQKAPVVKNSPDCFDSKNSIVNLLSHVNKK